MQLLFLLRAVLTSYYKNGQEQKDRVKSAIINQQVRHRTSPSVDRVIDGVPVKPTEESSIQKNHRIYGWCTSEESTDYLEIVGVT
jgi:hypothetical protein